MSERVKRVECRREFLRLLAASPLLALGGIPNGPWDGLMAAQAGRATNDVGGATQIISAPWQAINVFDFEAAAQQKIPIAHFLYLEGGVENGSMVRRNREGFTKFDIRDRRMVDTQNIDMSVNLFGKKWANPIALDPCGSQKAFHPEGEIAVAKAAGAKGHLMILSNATTSPIEEVNAAYGAPVWYQLYSTNVFDVTLACLKRAQSAGCPVVVFTVDAAGPNITLQDRIKNGGKDTAKCDECHGEGPAAFVKRKRMFDGIDVSKVTTITAKNINWDLVKRIKDATTMKLFLKGIITREDAQIAVENGVQGIVVSNHGGRTAQGTRSTIEILPEIIDAVGGRIPVLVDSGFRRGTDVFKALALGASAVCVGRPYLWGLGAFGQPGVETVLDMLTHELQAAMQQAGTTSIHQITRDYVERSS